MSPRFLRLAAFIAAACGAALAEPASLPPLHAQTAGKKQKVVIVKDTPGVVILKDSSMDETDSADAADTSDNANDTGDSSDHETPAVAGGDTRTLRIARQSRAVHDSAAPFHVVLSYGVGTLGMTPDDEPWLYDVRLTYAPKRLTPSVHYDTAARTLKIDTKSSNITMGNRHGGQDGGDLRVMLGRGVPIDAHIEFGAGDASLQFGGLSLHDLELSTGASDATIDWDQPNAVPLGTMMLHIGAAQFRGRHLANARARKIVVEAGAGDFDLDFGGDWSNDVDLDVTAALGAVRIHLPPGILFQKSSKVFIGSVDDNTGAVGASRTPGGPSYHLRLSGTATLGSIEIDRHTSR